MRQFTCLFLVFLLAMGCGFHLRGTQNHLSTRFLYTYLNSEMPIDSVYNRSIKALIPLNKGKLVDKKAAKVSVNVSALSTFSRQIALSKDSSLIEYENTYQLTVTITDLSNGVQLGSRKIQTTQNLQKDVRHILASQDQANINQSAAERTLAQLTIDYLAAF